MAAAGETLFVFAVDLNGVIVTGKGQSEKEAKDEALKQASHMVERKPVASPGDTLLNPANTSELGERKGVNENMIGKLQEYCQAHFWPFPQYTLDMMQGPSHTPNFSAKCKVQSYTAVATGTRKKEAKQSAAKMVLDLITKYETGSKGPGHRGSGSESDHHPIRVLPPNEERKASERKPGTRSDTFPRSTASEQTFERNSPKLDHTLSSPNMEERGTSERKAVACSGIISRSATSKTESLERTAVKVDITFSSTFIEERQTSGRKPGTWNGLFPPSAAPKKENLENASVKFSSSKIQVKATIERTQVTSNRLFTRSVAEEKKPMKQNSTKLDSTLPKEKDSENWISKLQTYLQKKQLPLPTYTSENWCELSHLPVKVKCHVLGFTGVGCGTRVTEAKQNAARMAFELITEYDSGRRGSGSESNCHPARSHHM